MYSNVLIKNLINIIELISNQNDINKELRHEKRKFCEVLIKQNYFQYQDTHYIIEYGSAMGVPTSSIFPEKYLTTMKMQRYMTYLLTYSMEQSPS